MTEPVPSSLLVQLAAGQRKIAALLAEMGDVLARLAEASGTHDTRLASLAVLPAAPRLDDKAVRDPRQLVGDLAGMPDSERQAFLGALESRREGGTYVDGWRAAVAALRDDARYERWWTAREYQPDQRYWETGPRNHLADYLRTIGPDGPEVTRG